MLQSLHQGCQARYGCRSGSMWEILQTRMKVETTIIKILKDGERTREGGAEMEKGGREGGRDGGRDGGREGGRKGGREEGGRKGGRKGGREGGK